MNSTIPTLDLTEDELPPESICGSSESPIAKPRKVAKWLLVLKCEGTKGTDSSMAKKRKLPDWMLEGSGKKRSETKCEKADLLIAKKARKVPEWKCKCTGNKKKEAEEEKNSEDKLSDENDDLNSFIKFTGKVIFIRDGDETALNQELGCLVEQIQNFHAETNEDFPLGFDLEWPVDRTKVNASTYMRNSGFIGGKVSLMQICPDENTVYIIQLSTYSTLPPIIRRLISLPYVKLVGNCVQQDARKIIDDFKFYDEKDAFQLMCNCRDLGEYANELFSPPQRWSLRNLCKYCLKIDLDKAGEVRMSDWARSDLTDRQIAYAATDAYVSLLLYNHMRKVEKANKKNLERVRALKPSQ